MIFGGVYVPWEVSHFFLIKSNVECIQNHVWGRVGGLVMTILGHLRGLSGTFADLRGVSRTFRGRLVDLCGPLADVSRTSRGPFADLSRLLVVCLSTSNLS